MAIVSATNFEPLMWPDYGYSLSMVLYSICGNLGIYCYLRSFTLIGPVLSATTFAVVTFPIGILQDLYYSPLE